MEAQFIESIHAHKASFLLIERNERTLGDSMNGQSLFNAYLNIVGTHYKIAFD